MNRQSTCSVLILRLGDILLRIDIAACCIDIAAARRYFADLDSDKNSKVKLLLFPV